MELVTKRLLLRGWTKEDANALYRIASNPQVGPICGWPVHQSVSESREVIENILDVENTYALCLKNTNEPIGTVSLKIGTQSSLANNDTEGELGFYIGVDYWGQGLIPEACREVIRYAFVNLGLEVIWCGYFDGNTKSARAQEKLGFEYDHTNKDIAWSVMGDIRTEHVTKLTKQEWLTTLSR